MKAEDRARILKAIAQARSWMNELAAGRIASTDAIALRQGCTERAIRLTLALAFISPKIVETIIAGRLPRGISIRDLAELPTAWNEQQARLGF